MLVNTFAILDYWKRNLSGAAIGNSDERVSYSQMLQFVTDLRDALQEDVDENDRQTT